MSWDIFVQDIPRGARSVADIPDAFSPQTIGSRQSILETICAVAPFADISDPTLVHLEAPGVDIEVSLGADDPLGRFAFHVRGGECSAGVVADILHRLHLRAFDPASSTGIFDAAKAKESFRQWQQYRDRVLQTRNI
jgi:hypothetical protein